MSFSFIVGLLAAFGLVIWGMISGGTGVEQVAASFIDLPSMYITFGGAIFATVMAVPTSDLKKIPTYLKRVVGKDDIDYKRYIEVIVELAAEARLKGLLSLEKKLKTVEMKDDFFNYCVMLIVDAMEPAKVQSQIENEMDCTEIRHEEAWNVFDVLGSFGPSFGMLGTLIGLINMLANMNGSDPGALGKGMSVALVTTFYGSVLVNMVCAPISHRLKAKHSKEMVLKSMIMEGVLMIQNGENPKVVEERLYSYLDRADRNKEEKTDKKVKKKPKKKPKKK